MPYIGEFNLVSVDVATEEHADVFVDLSTTCSDAHNKYSSACCTLTECVKCDCNLAGDLKLEAVDLSTVETLHDVSPDRINGRHKRELVLLAQCYDVVIR